MPLNDAWIVEPGDSYQANLEPLPSWTRVMGGGIEARSRSSKTIAQSYRRSHASPYTTPMFRTTDMAPLKGLGVANADSKVCGITWLIVVDNSI